MGNNVRSRCLSVLDSAWVANPGYTSPNRRQYPWQWLWDSCFQAIAWGALGDRRAVIEMETLFSGMLKSGFLPNTLFHNKPWAGWWIWRVRGHSTITQPPMYGHALRVLHDSGFAVDHLLQPASTALHHLIDSRMDAATGLVKVVHPWETGCDDSPRWSRWMRFGYHREFWNITKYRLARSMRVVAGEGVANGKFEVCPASFNALVAFNALELAALTGDDGLAAKARGIARSLEALWRPELRTWADVFPGSGKDSSAVPTLEAFLPLLVVSNPEQVEAAWAHLMSTAAFRRPRGFAGVSIAEPSYRSNGYWRGGCWPQICYLLCVAAIRRQRPELSTIRELTVRGILGSDLSEYWDPETGAACGAKPQSWSAILVTLAAEQSRLEKG